MVDVPSLLIGAFLGGLFSTFAKDVYQFLKKWAISHIGKPKLTKATLKERTITLFKDLMGFVSQRRDNEPQVDFDKWNESTNNLIRYSQETMNRYHADFGSRVVMIREEYLKRGITSDRVERFYTHPTNPLGIMELAYGLAELASKLETPSTSEVPNHV